MYVSKDGDLYGFCPGKATWSQDTVSIYQTLVIATETGIMYEDGPLSTQPDWWMELLAWFIPMYKDKVFWSRAKILMGSFAGEKKPVKPM